MTTMPGSFSPIQVATLGDTDVVLRGTFAVPPARIWRALTDPAILPKWVGMTDCDMDLHEGGAYVWRWAGPDGGGFTFEGHFVTLDPPHRMVHVEMFNGDPTARCDVTTELAPTPDGTRMTVTMRWPSAQARAAAIEAGMTDGLDTTYARLGEIAAASKGDRP